MVNCSVKGCKNRKQFCADDVSFHRFPSNEGSLRLWIQACGRKNWTSSESSRICSVHFENNLFMRSANKLCLKPGSVPTKYIHTGHQRREISNAPKKKFHPTGKHPTASDEIVHVCRVCLAADRKMYDMYRNNLEVAFENVTHLKLNHVDKLPETLCWECMHRLISCERFTNRAKRSNWLLTKLLEADEYLTSRNLKTIDRKEEKLISNLTNKTYPTNHYDLNLRVFEDDLTVNVTQGDAQIDPIEDIPIDIEVKDELTDETNEQTNLEQTEIIDLPEFVFNDMDAREKKLEPKEDRPCDDLLKLREIKKDKECAKKNKNKNVNGTKIDRRKKPATEVLNPTVFNITNLSFDEQMSEIEKRKETDNYKYSKHKCTECYKGFLEEDVYKSHMIRHSNQCGTFVCVICKIHFGKHHALQNHVTSHIQKFSCKHCPYVTTRRNAAKLHEDYHNGTRYQCPHCPDDFVKFSTYMSHVRIKHPSDFVCELCGFSFVSDKGLALHKKLKHRFDELLITRDSPYCEKCNINFATEKALQRHCNLSTRHKDSGLKQLVKKGRRPRDFGTECAPSAEKKGEKKRRNSKPEGPIPCEQCEMQLPDSLSYYRHFRSAHPDKNRTNYPSMKSKCMCEVCGRMFQSLALLQDHGGSHAEAKQFQCPQCHKRFQRRYRLVAHRRLHAAPRHAHPCGACGKVFTTASNMQRHLLSHTGLKPYKCEMCGKCFKHVSEKRVHVTYVHLKKPWPKRSRGRSKTDRQTSLTQAAVSMGASETEAPQSSWAAGIDPKEAVEV